jgi:hypothetical protein
MGLFGMSDGALFIGGAIGIILLLSLPFIFPETFQEVQLRNCVVNCKSGGADGGEIHGGGCVCYSDGGISVSIDVVARCFECVGVNRSD